MSVVSEAFGCTPSEAEAELLDGPAGMVFRVLELRAYKRKFDQMMDPDPKREVVYDDMYNLVMELHSEVIEEGRSRD